MALADLCYRCPACGHDPMAGKGDRAWCASCGFRAQRRRGRLFATAPGGEPRRTKAPALAGAAGPGKEVGKGFRCSAQAMVCWRIREEAVWRRGELRGWAETMGPASLGTVTVDHEAVAVESVAAPRDGSSGRLSGRWSHLELRAVQTSSSSLQISLPDDRLVQLRFTEDSPKRWEDMLRQLVREAYRRAGKGFVHEFQPRIAARPEPLGARPGTLPQRPESPSARTWSPSAMTWYEFFRPVAKGISVAMTRLAVEGRENIPRQGPFFLVANHQSVLDPILVQANCPRPVHSLTKSSQFSSGPVSAWLLSRINAVPTRRYRVDPQVVRTALRLLERGEAVCIYPEGERSWDGALQPLRRGTVRLILKAGVPVIPCGLKDSFDAWPRWSRRPRRCRVVLRFGAPMHFGRHDTRAERETVLDDAATRLATALAELSGQPVGAAVAA